ncbi:uncharacterized protein FIBRA_09479 [Fibroporia radiculosa]|uniref:Uncharacterized protein n=1 Tax=Fibroporia radiculosa TaxID=599839 RepID=J7RHS6_9APHY|nr:uncharacterized protein FIBRA_09479 [Fibroporia radiculosa]CCM07142.1 predicted protein [Fibroporia radiculosa]
MASVTILVVLLIISWFLIALLTLLSALAIFFLKDTYTFKVHLEYTPTPLTTPIDEQALNWANNGTQSPPSPPSPSSPSTSTPTFYS